MDSPQTERCDAGQAAEQDKTYAGQYDYRIDSGTERIDEYQNGENQQKHSSKYGHTAPLQPEVLHITA